MSHLARSHFSYEKRRKELEKKKKKEAKRLAKAERKAAQEAGEEVPEPVIEVDEFGNVIEVFPETEDDAESPETSEDSDEPDPTDAASDLVGSPRCRAGRWRWVCPAGLSQTRHRESCLRSGRRLRDRPDCHRHGGRRSWPLRPDRSHRSPRPQYGDAPPI